MKRNINDITVEVQEKIKREDSCDYNVSLTIPESYGWLEDPYFIIREGEENILYPLTYQKNQDNKVTFTGVVNLNTKALYHYFLSFKGNNQIYNITKDHIRTDFDLSDAFKLSVNFDVPDWAKGKIMYHIFVDRFAKGREEELQEMPRRWIHKSWDEDVQLGPDEEGIWNNDFFGGDLQGITDKLDYMKSLEVDILYLSPVVYSQSTHRYDAADYEHVDPYAGCNADLKKLCEEAHKREMYVILDSVFNHTGNDSKYFNQYNSFDTVGAYQSSDSPYLPFYDYHMENGQPVFKYWWGQKNLPKCNSNGQTWRNYITGTDGIIDQWFALGIDGLRLDVADELSDEFIEEIRKAVKRNKKDGLIIGEVWENPMRKNRDFLSSGKGMDTVMSYNFMSSLIKYFRYGDVENLDNKIKEVMYEYPDGMLFSAMNSTSTHDITRGINLWDKNIFVSPEDNPEWPWNLINNNPDFIHSYQLQEQYNRAKAIYMAYVYTLAFFPGTLSIFYGDEAGLQGIGNLENRKPFPWGKEDQELLQFFQEIGQIREKESFLQQADYETKEITPKHFAYERKQETDCLLYLVNRTNEAEPITIPEAYQEHSKIYTLKKSTPNILTPYGAIAIKK